jgi:hypothetical protein
MVTAQFRSTLDGLIVQFASLWKDFTAAMVLQVVVVTSQMADNISEWSRTRFWYRGSST